MRYVFFDERVSDYIRERLLQECTVRGTASEIARGTGYTRSEISAMINGVTNGGPEFALKMAHYWNLNSAQLQALACQADDRRRAEVARNEKPEPMPNLAQTLDWCRGVYPDRFLDEYRLQTYGQQPMVDRPKLEWLADIQARCYRWIAEQPLGSAKGAVHSQPFRPEPRNPTVAMASPVATANAAAPDEEPWGWPSSGKRAERKAVIRKERSGVQMSPKFAANEQVSGKAKAR